MPTHAKLVAVSDVAEQGLVEDGLVQEWHELLARYSAVFGTLECRLQENHGIGANEFEALERLATCDFKCRSADLTGAIHLSQSATSRLVARLEKEGLVERALCDVDRRGVFVTITDMRPGEVPRGEADAPRGADRNPRLTFSRPDLRWP